MRSCVSMACKVVAQARRYREAKPCRPSEQLRLRRWDSPAKLLTILADWIPAFAGMDNLEFLKQPHQ
jgi:hypothetical protein